MLLINLMKAIIFGSAGVTAMALLDLPLTWQQGIGLYSVVFLGSTISDIAEEQVIEYFNREPKKNTPS